jgi:hypothetical protein
MDLDGLDGWISRIVDAGFKPAWSRFAGFVLRAKFCTYSTMTTSY